MGSPMMTTEVASAGNRLYCRSEGVHSRENLKREEGLTEEKGEASSRKGKKGRMM